MRKKHQPGCPCCGPGPTVGCIVRITGCCNARNEGGGFYVGGLEGAYVTLALEPGGAQIVAETADCMGFVDLGQLDPETTYYLSVSKDSRYTTVEDQVFTTEDCDILVSSLPNCPDASPDDYLFNFPVAFLGAAEGYQCFGDPNGVCSQPMRTPEGSISLIDPKGGTPLELFYDSDLSTPPTLYVYRNCRTYTAPDVVDKCGTVLFSGGDCPDLVEAQLMPGSGGIQIMWEVVLEQGPEVDPACWEAALTAYLPLVTCNGTSPGIGVCPGLAANPCNNSNTWPTGIDCADLRDGVWPTCDPIPDPSEGFEYGRLCTLVLPIAFTLTNIVCDFDLMEFEFEDTCETGTHVLFDVLNITANLMTATVNLNP